MSRAAAPVIAQTLANAPAPGARVVVGLSGGVDSAVAALRLRDLGFDVQAVFMKNWEEDDTDAYCSAAEDLADAEAICEALGLPLHTVNLSFDYWERVFERFLAEYEGGRTPNPDVLCNQEIKFRAFAEHAEGLGAERMATGHYAGLAWRRDAWRLVRSADAGKDQTYFLHTLSHGQLARAMFPLQALTKHEVREIALAAGLPVHDKADSTGICFIGERSMKEFLGRYLRFEPGPIVTPEGEQVGEHAGLPVYTIGQRKGLQIGGRADSNGEPWYVAAKREATNELVVVQGHDHPALLSRGLVSGPVHWVNEAPRPMPFRCAAQIRHRQPPQPCEIAPREGGFTVRFEQPQRAVAPGQSVAFYDGDECLGGAEIERSGT